MLLSVSGWHTMDQLRMHLLFQNLQAAMMLTAPIMGIIRLHCIPRPTGPGSPLSAVYESSSAVLFTCTHYKPLLLPA